MLALIEKVKEFNHSLEMPTKLSEVGISEENFEVMSSEAVRTSGLASRAYVKLDSSDVLKILQLCK